MKRKCIIQSIGIGAPIEESFSMQATGTQSMLVITSLRGRAEGSMLKINMNFI